MVLKLKTFDIQSHKLSVTLCQLRNDIESRIYVTENAQETHKVDIFIGPWQGIETEHNDY